MTGRKATLAVLGAGSWGTVLAWLLAKNGHRVRLWTRHKEHALEMQAARANTRYFPFLNFPETLEPLSQLETALANVDAGVMAVPSSGLREVLAQMPKTRKLISASKGLELGSFKRFSEVILEYQPDATIATLSGPNLAREIAEGKPTATTIASATESFAKEAQHWFNQATFRVYTSKDIIGVEVAGALKNVIALAAGMSDGLQLGDNAKASIITRGLSELVRLGNHLGGNSKTFYGLAGLGDMVATCMSSNSRNHRAGERIAQGEKLKDLNDLTAEGIPTVRAVYFYAQGAGLELPISSEVYQVIFEGKSPLKALKDLMLRSAKAE